MALREYKLEEEKAGAENRSVGEGEDFEGWVGVCSICMNFLFLFSMKLEQDYKIVNV